MPRFAGETDEDGLTRDDALQRMADAEDTLRAIGAGEVDAFVLSNPGGEQRVFTLSTADRPYRMFVEHMRDGAATMSSSGLILYVNQRLADMLGCSREEIVGQPLSRFATQASLLLGASRSRDADGAKVEIELSHSSGVAVPVLVGRSLLEIDGDEMICLTIADLSSQKEQEREIMRLGEAQTARLTELQDAQSALTMQATHDALTGLPNRHVLVDRIDQALAYAARSRRSTAVFFIDLDGFKQINDTHGHAAGDRELRRVADVLVGALRPMDTVARLGGDEFAVLAPNMGSHLDAVDLSGRLVAALNSGPMVFDPGTQVGASVGIAVSVEGRGSAEILLQEADTAMYHAKSLGGSRREVFDAALGFQLQERVAAQRMLQDAVDEQRIILHYQPIVEIATGYVASFEALARIRARDGSILPPSTFIAIAEESGLIVPIGSQILESSCGEATTWMRPTGADAPAVSVNLSPRQLEAGDLPAQVHEHLSRSELAPHRLQLELTETAIMDLRPTTLDQLARVRDLGVQIGLDDFGTGYASLTHLRRLPLEFVKIDKSFVQGLGVDREDDRIVSAVIDLAANLGLRSIAEGVETADQLERLRVLGCDQVQGYLFARPSPAGEIGAMLERVDWRV